MTLEARGTGCHRKNFFVHVLLLYPFSSIVCYRVQDCMGLCDPAQPLLPVADPLLFQQ